MYKRQTVGSIEDEIGKITNSEMISALIKKFSEYYFVQEPTLDQTILDKAHKIEDNYSIKNTILDLENSQSTLKGT